MNTEMTDVSDFKGGNGWVLYDGACPLCIDLANRFARILGRRGFHILPLQTAWVERHLYPGGVGLDAEMCVLARSGLRIGGADAVAYLARFIWWAWPICVVWSLPGMPGLFRSCYRWIADRRHCMNGTCQLPERAPARQFWAGMDRPVEIIREVDRSIDAGAWVPIRDWIRMGLLALAGTIAFGLSGGLPRGELNLLSGALRFSVVTGLSWLVFGGLATLVSRVSPWTIAHASFVAMTFGEAVLLVGSLFNNIMRFSVASNTNVDLGMARVVVLIANGLMAFVMLRQLKALRVPYRVSMALWIFGLNGTAWMLWYWMF